MATGYKYLDTDLDDILEPYRANSPSPDFTNYTVNGASLVGRYEGKTRDWQRVMTGGGYYYRSQSIPAVLKGYNPSVRSAFYTIEGSAGQGERNIYITRYSDRIAFTGSVTVNFYAGSFRNGAVPYVIGIVFCGGGSGGRAETTGSGKDAHTWYSGGGGGSTASVVIDLTNNPVMLKLGQGGAYGGGNNSFGGASGIYISPYGSNDYVIRIEGGAVGGGSGNNPGGNEKYQRVTVPYVYNDTGTILTVSNINFAIGGTGVSSGRNALDENILWTGGFCANEQPISLGPGSVTTQPRQGGASCLGGGPVGSGSGGTNGRGGGYGSSGGAGKAIFYY